MRRIAPVGAGFRPNGEAGSERAMSSADKEAEWAEFRADVEEEGLADHVEALVRLCVPSLRLRPAQRARGASRLGGVPDVPAGFVWPVSSGVDAMLDLAPDLPGVPLVCVAQIDLADVHVTGLPGVEALPARGRLVFFHGYEPPPDGVHVGNAGRVFFFDDGAPLGPATEPTHPQYRPFPATAVTFEPQTEQLPPFESPFYATLLDDAGALAGAPREATAIFDGVVSAYGPEGVRDEGERPVHRLLGYADPDQSDVYIAAHGNSACTPFDTWETPAHYRAAAEWRLLLQVDSDPQRGMMLGDLGVLYFLIRPEDLAARRFDRVWVDWQQG